MNATWLKYLPGFLRNRLEGRFNLQQIVGNSGWLLLDRLVRSGLTFVIIIWLARYLGPQQFGIYSYVVAFVLIFNAIATVGLDSIVIRELVRTPDERNEILGTAFVLKLLGGGVSFTAAVVAIYFLRPGDELMLMLVTISAAGSFFLAFDVVDFWFQSRVEAKYTVIARNVPAILVVSVKAGLIILEAPLIAFFIAGLIEIVLAGIALAIIYTLRGGKISVWRITTARTASLLKDSWPLLFSAMVIVIYMKVDQIMIGELLGEREVGIYSAAVRLVEMWYVVPMSIASSIFPTLYKLRSSQPELYLQRLQQFFDIMVIIPVVVGVFMWIAAEPIIVLLFGEEYRGAAGVFRIYIWSSVFVFLIIAISQYLIAENKTIFALVRNSIAMVINVALNWVLIPIYGIEGAAVATLIAYLFSAYFANWLYKDMRPIFKMETNALLLNTNLKRLYGNK